MIGVTLIACSIIDKKSPRRGRRAEPQSTGLKGQTRTKHANRTLERLHLSSRYFLKRSKTEISEDVKLLSGYFECSQRNPDQQEGARDPVRNNLVDCDAVIVNGLTSCHEVLTTAESTRRHFHN